MGETANVPTQIRQGENLGAPRICFYLRVCRAGFELRLGGRIDGICGDPVSVLTTPRSGQTYGMAQNRREHTSGESHPGRRVFHPTDPYPPTLLKPLRRFAARVTPPLPLALGPYSNCVPFPGYPTFFRSVWRSIWTVRLRRGSRCKRGCCRLRQSLAQQ